MLSLVATLCLFRLSNGICGHYDGIPLNTCTEINYENDNMQSFLYSCNATDNTFSKLEFNTSDCSGNGGPPSGWMDKCEAWNVQSNGRCICDESIDCDIATTRINIDCNPNQYTQTSYVINQCIPESASSSELKTCNIDRDNPIITTNYNDHDCSCLNDQFVSDDISCQVTNNGDNIMCPHVMRYPINECASTNKYDSFMFICQYDVQTGNYTYSKRQFYKPNCDDAWSHYDGDYTEFCMDNPTDCFCGIDGNLSSTDNCYMAKSHDITGCAGESVNETIILNECMATGDSISYNMYSCNNNILSVNVYYDNQCSDTEQNPSSAPTPRPYLNPNCTQDFTYKCDYHQYGDDSSCGHFADNALNVCSSSWYDDRDNIRSEMAICRYNASTNTKTYHIMYFNSLQCVGDPYDVRDWTHVCEENGGSQTCNCGDGLHCNLAEEEFCGRETYQEYVHILGECIWDNVVGAYYIRSCDVNDGFLNKYYPDDTCTATFEPTIDPTAQCITTTTNCPFPTNEPSQQPSGYPSKSPSNIPSTFPSNIPSEASESPTAAPNHKCEDDNCSGSNQYRYQCNYFMFALCTYLIYVMY